MTTKDRTLEFITFKGLSVKKFEEMCGLSNGYVNSMRSGYGNSKLAQVMSAFPELNREWLVYGEGSMIKDEVNSHNNSSASLGQTSEVLPLQDDALIAELRSQIERLESKIDYLNQELGEKNALIKMMRQGGSGHAQVAEGFLSANVG